MRTATRVGALLLFVVLTAAPSGAGDVIEGTLTAVNAASLEIDGETYVVTRDTRCQDRNGGRVDVEEIRAGAAVEAEVENGGKLGVVTIDLLR